MNRYCRSVITHSASCAVLLFCSAALAGEIKDAVTHNRTAQNLAQWRTGALHPSKVFDRARKSGNSWASICAELRDLPTPDLAVFDDEINDPHNRGLAPCRSELKIKLRDFWKESSQRLGQRKLLNQLQMNGQFLETEAALPSVEQPLDTSAGPLLYRGNLKIGQIALTFDDGPHSVHTPEILRILTDSGIRANYFEVGEKAQAIPELSKTLVDAGQIVGSHSWSHPQLSKLTLDNAETEINSGRDAVSSATGVFVPFFRFPFGERIAPLVDFVRSEQMAMFYWNMDSLDWKIQDPVALFQNVVNELDREKRGIILFHDVHPQTVVVLPHFLDELRARHFTTVVFVPH